VKKGRQLWELRRRFVDQSFTPIAPKDSAIIASNIVSSQHLPVRRKRFHGQPCVSQQDCI